MPKKVNSRGEQQEYVPKGFPDGGEYTNNNGLFRETKNILDEAKRLGIEMPDNDNFDVLKARVKNAKVEEIEEKTRTIVRGIEKEIHKLSYETGAIIDKSGVVLQKVNGARNEVFVDGSLLKGAIMTHNHPNGGSFSVQDIDSFLQCDAYQIRATTPQGKTFVLTKGRDFVLPSLAVDYKNAGTWRSVGAARVQELYETYLSSGWSASDALYKAQSDYKEEWLFEHAKEYYVKFEVEWDD